MVSLIENDTILFFRMIVYLFNELNILREERNLQDVKTICISIEHGIVQLFRSCWVNLFISTTYAIHHSSLNCIAHHAPVYLFVCFHVQKKDGLTPVKQTHWISYQNIQGVHCICRRSLVDNDVLYISSFKDDQITDERTWLSQETTT